MLNSSMPHSFYRSLSLSVKHAHTLWPDVCCSWSNKSQQSPDRCNQTRWSLHVYLHIEQLSEICSDVWEDAFLHKVWTDELISDVSICGWCCIVVAQFPVILSFVFCCLHCSRNHNHNTVTQLFCRPVASVDQNPVLNIIINQIFVERVVLRA